MKKILKWNPEFAKNLWIEFTPLRLIVLPAILFIVVVLVYMNGDPQIKAWENVHLAATIGFVFVGMLWGIKTASDAILDEYNERTWDWQKMSSQTRLMKFHSTSIEKECLSLSAKLTIAIY